MADKVEVTNFPIDSSKERVALELMEKIMTAEDKYARSENPDRRASREYILTLYRECLAAAGGYPRKL